MKRAAIIALILFSAEFAAAQQPAPTGPEFANCSWYRSKRDDVPVFADADTTSKIISRATLGEKLCGIGELKGFAIIEWGKQELIRGSSKKEKDLRAYVRLVELWEPREHPDMQQEQAKAAGKDVWGYKPPGTAPDDPIWFLRPFLNIFYSQDPCKDKSRIGCK